MRYLNKSIFGGTIDWSACATSAQSQTIHDLMSSCYENYIEIPELETADVDAVIVHYDAELGVYVFDCAVLVNYADMLRNTLGCDVLVMRASNANKVYMLAIAKDASHNKAIHELCKANRETGNVMVCHHVDYMEV